MVTSLHVRSCQRAVLCGMGVVSCLVRSDGSWWYGVELMYGAAVLPSCCYSGHPTLTHQTRLLCNTPNTTCSEVVQHIRTTQE